jgi:PadR family transcriptional regulator PadR
MKGKSGCECDMRGMLSFSILWLLSKKPMHGQQLAKEIEKRKGSRPTPGTIYPALKELSARGLIRGVKEGRTITYKITPRGQKAVSASCDYVCRMFGDVVRKHMG